MGNLAYPSQPRHITHHPAAPTAAELQEARHRVQGSGSSKRAGWQCARLESTHTSTGKVSVRAHTHSLSLSPTTKILKSSEHKSQHGGRGRGWSWKRKNSCQRKNNLDQRDVFLGLHRVAECQRTPRVQIHLERNYTFVMIFK